MQIVLLAMRLLSPLQWIATDGGLQEIALWMTLPSEVKINENWFKQSGKQRSRPPREKGGDWARDPSRVGLFLRHAAWRKRVGAFLRCPQRIHHRPAVQENAQPSTKAPARPRGVSNPRAQWIQDADRLLRRLLRLERLPGRGGVSSPCEGSG